ncbi:MAG: helix-turn-helix transcriptional regulator [Gammaproteobacteria bacterium]
MTPNAAMAHLRQLACLGVGAGVAMPDVLEVITHAVPSGNNTFVGTDESYLCRSVVMRHSTPALLETLFTKRATDYKRPCDHHESWWRTAPAALVLDAQGTAYADLQRTSLYFECMRPFGQHHLLEALIRKGGRPAGYLHLFRDHRARKFSEKDVRRLVSLLPYIALTLSDSTAADLSHAPSHTSAVLIVDSKGRIQHRSTNAETLLRYAFNPGARVDFTSSAAVAAMNAQLLRRLRASMRGRSADANDVPLVEIRNGRGLFTFRAHWLTQDEAETECRACIVVEHAEPLPLRFMRGLAQLSLSPAQKRVALLIACGRSRESIARDLRLSHETVKDYARLIYTRLGVHDRHQLAARVLDAAAA